MMEYLIYQDGLDGKVDGMIEVAQHNTSDAFLFGPNTFIGSVYLAALRACEEMAKIMGDNQLAEYYHQLFVSGRQYALEKLWNGEYFINIFPENAKDQYHAIGYNDGCHIDQLFGQTWAHQLGLGYLYPEEYVKKAMESLFKYNWTPDHREVYSDEYRSRAMGAQAYPGDSGMLTVTYPKLKKGDQRPNYWYSDYTWTGFEYHAASLMLYEGLLEEGLAVYRGVHERYDGQKHNPWNEIEGADHYTRAMASWGRLISISGFIYDGPAGIIGFSPRISPEDFKCFFSSSEGWGSLVQKRNDHVQVNHIQVKWGVLAINKVVMEIPEDKIVEDYSIQLDGSACSAKVEREGKMVVIRFSETKIVSAGKELVISLNLK